MVPPTAGHPARPGLTRARRYSGRAVTTPPADPSAHDSAPRTLDEHSARQVVMVRAWDALPPDSHLWSAEDRAWATRLARTSCPGDVPTERFVAERARHAWQRLVARDPSLARWAAARLWRPAWLGLALGAGAAFGLLLAHLGDGQRINLLSWPAAGLLAWNLGVFAASLWPARRGAEAPVGGLRGALAARLTARLGGVAEGSPAAAGALDWARRAQPLSLARGAALLHGAAAAVALGMVGHVYLSGLVLDYRVGWQSTFLDAPQVQRLLDAVLAPASAVSGIAVPSVDALRTGGEAAPVGPAAPWLHLYALTLLLWVALPRGLLAGLALWRAARLSRALPLPWHEAYFQQFERARSGAALPVQVWPHGAAPGEAGLHAMRGRLTAGWGDALQWQVQPPTAAGDEDSAAAPSAMSGPAPVLRLAWFDLTATPEAETQGRWLQVLQRQQPPAELRVVVDETAFRARFAAYPERLAQRRQAWRAWAAAYGSVVEFIPGGDEL